MPNYQVRVYYNSFADFEIEAENGQEAREIAETYDNMQISMYEIQDNMVVMEGETQVMEY